MSIKNSCVFLFTGHRLDRVLLLRNHKGKWMLPGGMIDQGETPFQAMKREFKEETGCNLPWISGVKKFDFHGHTWIYLAYTFNVIGPFKVNSEAAAMKFVKIKDIFDYDLRGCVKKSMSEMFKRGLLDPSIFK